MIKTPGNNFKYFLQLSKIKIMIPVSLTGFTGYFIFSPHFSAKILLTTIGIFLLAVSASVLNQIQEIDIDGKMNRTHNRPLPSNIISLKYAIIFLIITFCSGITIIYSKGNLLAAIIGLTTIFWYNGVYTYLKRITAFAVVPGAITGALPPLIGWVAAGGGIFDRPILFLEFLFFTGQIPHFWLLVLNYGEEYKNAGIPSLTSIFKQRQINRLTFIWIVTSVIAAMFLCYFEIINNGPIVLILLIASLLIVWQFFDLIKTEAGIKSFRRYSIILDSYFLLVLILLISDRLITQFTGSLF